MKARPTITVIIPTFNYSPYIREAIESVRSCTFPQDEIEIIVVDDGSTDDTRMVVAQYGDVLRYFYQPNAGKAAATRAAIYHARGKYIFNLDADDFYLPDKIDKIVAVFEHDDEIVHVAHPAIVWNAQTDKKNPERIPKTLVGHRIAGDELLLYFYRRNMLFGGGSTFAGRAEVLKKVVIPTSIDMYVDEYLVIHTLRHGDSFFVEQPLSVWRVHAHNYSGSTVATLDAMRKRQRSLENQLAVLDSVLAKDFPPEFKALYRLKYQTNLLATKELDHTKNLADIIGLWGELISNLRLFGLNTIEIAQAYMLLNRSLPTTLLNVFRRAKMG